MPRTAEREVEVEGRCLRLTNVDKVLYPETGFTKGALIDYYARVVEFVLPHLRDRPLTLKPYPDGVEGPHFFKKRCPGERPEWMATAAVPSERHGTIEYCLATDLPSLVWLANRANIELHVTLARAGEIQRPTAMAFDLDPGDGLGLLDCCQVATLIRGMLSRLGLESLVKVSGKKGVHLWVPLNGADTYERVQPFSRQVAETLEQAFPDRVTASQSKAKRRGRILVDWSQNTWYKSTACAYSLRATPEPRVSVPVDWDELEAACEAEDEERLRFAPEEALDRLEERGDLFGPALTLTQELPASAG
jgi:bifunctional non-homologous end joining protein LigD